MGIINLTPDSFSDGGRYVSVSAALAHARRLWAEGADMLDLGAESTRPGAMEISVEEELDRLLPALEAIRAEIPLPISVDTRKATVMRAAHAYGATLINDVSALSFDPAALTTVAELGLDVCLMHMRGTPATMQTLTAYENVLTEVRDYLVQRRDACLQAGIPAESILLDPGIGFAKEQADNLRLLRHLDQLATLGHPILLGLSRKRFLGQIAGVENASERVVASVAALLWTRQLCRSSIYRVHDVAATRQALNIWEAMEATG
ncbi:dihydropteroate synthase [Acidithiobacillus sp. AMEEHan]|uniref:dihydropteroate synthase n=1 Tax=Acidithiobacillus sp. AMEEHan TaxID=2994951 RepID=UPI0027E3D760|nr:dihydropteroate synthase [Acidithiobacillus sp. AMEEHan]